jgi:hypothetical protein
MNHTSTINIWKDNNRISQLWEVLLADYVSPDPVAGEYVSSSVDLEPAFPLETWEAAESSFTTSGGQSHSPVPALLERAGFESLRLFRQALEVLTAPAEEEPALDTGRGQDLKIQPSNSGELDESMRYDSIHTDSALALGMTFIKVSSEPEPQPGSSIDTRRMAYGLKVPVKPLHKRPVYQRVFFCLRNMLRQGKDDPSSHR